MMWYKHCRENDQVITTAETTMSLRRIINKRPMLRRYLNHVQTVQRFSDSTTDKDNIIIEDTKTISRAESSTGTGNSGPELPSTCCMSGCANCVWLDYAEQMVEYYDNIGLNMDFNKLLETVDSNVDDPMVKAFLKMELKSKYVFNKKWRTTNYL